MLVITFVIVALANSLRLGASRRVDPTR
jgi:hypothetical protein